MSKKVLVTGGAGFIGSHLVDAMIKRGNSVIVIDDLSSGSKANLNPHAEFYELDIRSAEAINVIKQTEPNLIFHFAAQISVPESFRDPLKDIDLNLISTIKLLESAKDLNLEKFVFISTGGGMSSEQTELPTPESAPALTSPYALSKSSAEMYGELYRQVFGIPFVAIRPANVYGPRQNPHGEAGVVAIFIKRMLAGEELFIDGEGTDTRDYIYVKDLIDGILKVTDSPDSTGAYNIGTEKETSVNDLFNTLQGVLNYQKNPNHREARRGAVKRSVLSISKIKSELNWSPNHTLQSGIQETVDWFKNN